MKITSEIDSKCNKIYNQNNKQYYGDNMELRVLKYFLTIAREENFTKAAKQLHITQPTLSRQIASLEEELGTKLFYRNNHSITLTDDGLLLKRRAQEIIALSDMAKKDLIHSDKNIVGTVNIGSGEFLSSKYLADCIAEFSNKYPEVNYEIHSGNSANVCDNIDKGLLDVGLISEPFDTDKYNYITMPVKEKWGVLVKDDSPLANREFITPKDLIDVPIITSLGEFPKSRIAKWLGNSANDIKIVAKGNLLYNESVLAQSNIGAVICIKLNCNYDELSFIPLNPEVNHETALIWKKGQTYSAATSAFIDFTNQYLKGITDD